MLIIAKMLFCVFILYIMFLWLREYNELKITKYRFKYFALRDELAMLVINGKLEENSWEYKHIISTINFHINATESMSIMRVVDLLIRYHTSSEEEKEIEFLEKRVDNEEMASIIAKYMSITIELIKRNSRTQIYLIRIAKYFLEKICGTAKLPKHAIIPNPNQALSKLDARKISFEKKASFGNLVPLHS